MHLSENSVKVLKLFESGSLLSAVAVSAQLFITRSSAQDKLDSLKDMGLLKKANSTQYSIAPKGRSALDNLDASTEEPEEEQLTDAKIDKELDAAFEELLQEQSSEPAGTSEQEPAAETVAASEVVSQSVDVHPDAEKHPAIVALEELEQKLAGQSHTQIDDLDLKREVLVRLSRLLAQDIADVLVEIVDDLNRATGTSNT